MPNTPKYKIYAVYLVLICVVIIIVYALLNISSYINPLAGCKIKIETATVQNNKKVIKKSIKELKKQDRSSYQDLCEYIKVISEKMCFISDPHVEEEKFIEGREKTGCYVRGSKTIYLNPNNFNSDSIDVRVLLLKKYTAMSKDFWLE